VILGRTGPHGIAAGLRKEGTGAPRGAPRVFSAEARQCNGQGAVPAERAGAGQFTSGHRKYLVCCKALGKMAIEVPRGRGPTETVFEQAIESLLASAR
jgi:hypothetical protein